jgi:anti-anti-sigma factor
MVAFNYNTEEKILTVAITGRMDTVTVLKLNEMIVAEPVMNDWQPEDKIIFDLSEVDYISSSFIRICVLHAKKAGTGRFFIAHCQPFVKKTFKISGLDEVLNIT